MAENVVSGIAAAVAFASLAFALHADRRTRQARRIEELLGEKETVAFGASTLLAEGFPRKRSERTVVIQAVLHACLFEGSDRARAMLLAAIDQQGRQYRQELEDAFTDLQEIYEHMKRFHFSQKELDLSNADLRLGVVEKVLRLKPGGADPSAHPTR